ncbi:uncharacterized protein LOC135480647 [Liolophura sinensis]|uniref:uncharacterized protein LOC135480647 n=1 Tax=Liolophura sinensis TaxID=3198878 RepID=UPI0031592F22
MGSAGLALSCLEALCTSLLGFKVTCTIIAIGVPTFCGLFALAAYYHGFVHKWPSIVCLIQLVLATINCNAYFAVSRVFVGILPEKHTGKLVALYMAMCCCGKMFFGGLMELFFWKNLAGFFMSCAIASTLTYVPCFVLQYPLYTEQKHEPETKTTCADGAEEHGNASTTSTSVRDILRSPFFHVTFWISALFYGCGMTCTTNITTIAQSAGVADPLQSVFVLTVVIFTVRVCFGTTFDRFASMWCGFALLLVAYSSFVAAMTISILYLSSTSMFLTTILIGVGMAPGLITPVSILLLRYGRSHYSAVAGCFYTVSATYQILLQLFMGILYDAEIPHSGISGKNCMGTVCFYWCFRLLLGITISVIVIQTFNFVISENYSRLRQRFSSSSLRHNESSSPPFPSDKT